MDPFPSINKKQKIYHIIGYDSWNSIRIYNDFESFKKQNFDELRLPINGYGSNWTIFKNNLYYCADSQGIRIVKINLDTLNKDAEKKINDNAGVTGQWVVIIL